jgi:hypothetical protein
VTLPPDPRPSARMILLNAVLVAVVGAATVVGLGATTGPNQPTTPTSGNPGVSYTVAVPTPPNAGR